ncbi:hypothetical protein BB561_005825 [Smittium simulii]|uniref:F-box domain-containing protein n=1 Tax=Smittium simulii TaxID=133385 RepID=A0A2T9Y816_9FUNG|nr:hypothetical protein BB561_005825 [Smittium simulii]
MIEPSTDISLHQHSLISRINQDILINIFSYLPPKDLDAVSLVCTEWCILVNQNNSWKNALCARLGNCLPFKNIDLMQLNWYTANPAFKNKKNNNFWHLKDTENINKTEKEECRFYSQSEETVLSYPEQHKNRVEMAKNIQARVSSGSKKASNNKYKAVNTPYNLFEDKAKAKLLAFNNNNKINWKMEYITRLELLRNWTLGKRLVKIEAELGIGTIHNVFTNFKHGYVISASLTHGVALKSGLDSRNFGRLQVPKSDLFFASGFCATDASAAASRSLPLGTEVSIKMQTVEFFSIKINKFYSIKPILPSEDSQNLRKSSILPNQDLKYDRIAILWGGLFCGRVIVHYLHKKSGSLDRIVQMNPNNNHSGKVICTKFVEQMKILLCSNLSPQQDLSPELDSLNVIISGGSDGFVKVWDAENGILLADLNCCEITDTVVSITCLSVIQKQFIVAGTNSGKIIIWDLNQQQQLAVKILNSPATINNTIRANTSLISKIVPIIINCGISCMKPDPHKANILDSKSSISGIFPDHQNNHFLVSCVFLYNSFVDDDPHMSATPSTNFSHLCSIGVLEKYCASTGNLIESYQWPNQKPLSALFWDCYDSDASLNLNSKQRRVKLLIAGDIAGNLFYWDFDSAFNEHNILQNCDLDDRLTNSYHLIASGTHLLLFTCDTTSFIGLGSVYDTKKAETKKDFVEKFEEHSISNENVLKIEDTHIIPLIDSIDYNYSNKASPNLRTSAKGNTLPNVVGRRAIFKKEKKDISSEIQNEKLKYMEKSTEEQQNLIETHNNRVYLQSEYLRPLQDLEMNDDQLLKYAEIVSQENNDNLDFSDILKAKNVQSGEYNLSGLTDDEMLQYAEFISKSDNNYSESSSTNALKNDEFVLSGLSDNEMLEYAMFLSRNPSI